MKNENKEKSSLDSEEYGYDLSPDDLDVRVQNNVAKKNNDNENKDKPTNKNNPSKLNL